MSEQTKSTELIPGVLRIDRVKVLQGHTSPETAYVVDDYPYGRVLRCKIRYWIETAVKGGKAGQQRFMRQTTDPRKVGEVWNKAHGSTYSGMALLYIDPATGYVEWTGISAGFGVDPEYDARLRFMGIVDQMTAADRRLYDVYVHASQKYVAPWIEYTETLQVLREYAAANNGELPQRDRSLLEIPAGTLPGRPSAFRRVIDDHRWPTYVQSVLEPLPEV